MHSNRDFTLDMVASPLKLDNQATDVNVLQIPCRQFSIGGEKTTYD